MADAQNCNIHFRLYNQTESFGSWEVFGNIMHTEYPDYYNKFQCIADKCRDTCCRSWEVDVDEDTFYYYKVQEGEFGKYLNAHLHEDDDYKYIPMKEDGYCPFLTKEGLCDIYCHLGEQAMCQVCQEYPRYYMGVGDYEQIDLSLSCMEVGRLLFLHHGPIHYEKSEDEEEPWETITESEHRRLENILRIRDELVKQAQSGMERILVPDFDLLSSTEAGVELLPDAVFDTDLRRIIASFEILDDRGGELLKNLEAHYDEIVSSEAEFRKQYEDLLPVLFSRFAVYLIYRYTIDSFYEKDLSGEIRLWNRSLRLMLLLCMQYYQTEKAFGVGPMINLAHTFSRQIEHSDENMEKMKRQE